MFLYKKRLNSCPEIGKFVQIYWTLMETKKVLMIMGDSPSLLLWRNMFTHGNIHCFPYLQDKLVFRY